MSSTKMLTKIRENFHIVVVVVASTTTTTTTTTTNNVGCSRTEENKKWDVLHPLICKAHLT